MVNKFRADHPEYNDMTTPELTARIHANHYPDMSKEQFDMMFIGRPNHNDLESAAVRGKDSLDLQDKDPSVKPAVKMTLQEFMDADIPPEKPFFSDGKGIVYVFAPNAPKLSTAIENIISGNDSEILGYPDPGECDCCVTKDGEVVTDLPTMHHHAQNGNIAWGASGAKEPLMAKAWKVAGVLKRAVTPPKGE